MPVPPLPSAGERGVPKRVAGMGGCGVTPLCSPGRWREAGGGDGSWAASGGSAGVGTAQEGRGFQREPRGRSDGNGGGKGPVEVWEQSALSLVQLRVHQNFRFCPAALTVDKLSNIPLKPDGISPQYPTPCFMSQLP